MYFCAAILLFVRPRTHFDAQQTYLTTHFLCSRI